MKMSISTVILCCLATFNAQALQTNAQDPRYEKRSTRKVFDFNLAATNNEIKIMAYNVENLFDTVHDEGKSDWEFLPKAHELKKNCANEGSFRKKCEETDWTPERLAVKLKQIHRAVAAQGSLPDILALEEIENESVVGMLAKEMGYEKFVVSNSPDARGIDLAILYDETKIRFVSSQDQDVGVKGLKTRNLLVANFTVKGSKETFGVFVNHWPSQGKNSNSRMEVAQALKKFVEAQAKGHADYHAILVGDFNTIDADQPHPIHEVVTHSSWTRGFYDVHNLFDGMKTDDKLKMPPGTYFYFGDGAWNRLDRMFVSRSLVDKKGLELVPESFRVVAPEFMTRAYEYYSTTQHQFASVIFGVPKGYDHNSTNPDKAGFSDHFPLVMKLKLN